MGGSHSRGEAEWWWRGRVVGMERWGGSTRIKGLGREVVMVGGGGGNGLRGCGWVGRRSGCGGEGLGHAGVGV